jgi:hypothetical protein
MPKCGLSRPVQAAPSDPLISPELARKNTLTEPRFLILSRLHMDPSYNALPANIANLLKRTELSIRRFRSEWTRSPSHVFENHVLLIELADMQSSLTALTVAVNRIRSGSDSMPAPSLINVDKLGPA